LVCRRGGDLKV